MLGEFLPGDTIEGVYLLLGKWLNTTSKGNYYLNFKIGDRSGKLPCRMWNVNPDIPHRLEGVDFVFLSGRVNTYQKSLQLVADRIEPASPHAIDPEDFLPVTSRDRDEMEQQVFSHIQAIASQNLRRMTEFIFNDRDFFEKFRDAPAAKEIHHACIGGLMEHTLAVVELSMKLSALYSNLNQDLLRTGALLHDIGKVDELSWKGRIKYTDRGRLAGHIILGMEKIADAIRRVDAFSTLERDLLSHMILSHHGQLDFGSPVKPLTLEAIALHYLDDLDAKLNAFQRCIDESTGLPGNWTEYHRIFERFIFKGDTSFTDRSPAG
jgi:3'-5' exoribonuclease